MQDSGSPDGVGAGGVGGAGGAGTPITCCTHMPVSALRVNPYGQVHPGWIHANVGIVVCTQVVPWRAKPVGHQQPGWMHAKVYTEGVGAGGVGAGGGDTGGVGDGGVGAGGVDGAGGVGTPITCCTHMPVSASRVNPYGQVHPGWIHGNVGIVVCTQVVP